ncbi:iron ABC transporter permease [Phytohabitans sp. ZYX-F-186]|uniref:Iron ABC transporter permease n=1 Tax=Phytohabitans maris TaxID=3071409 RepID=A0ABU0ZC43_9ACTN|nr:iron ABC transporter permease [Phytohabitans sp. ZYX-F-186]MDQ7904617.1 iron ABC transporter permease [Phytohabitans sp. ZYX-F-186]
MTWAMAAAVVVPLLAVLYESLRKRTGLLTSVWSLDSYRALFTPRIYEAAFLSFKFGLGSAIFATVVGTVLAFLIVRTDVPGRRFIELASYVPFFLSSFLLAVCWQYVGSPNTGLVNRLAIDWGLADSAFLNIYSEYGIILVVGIAHTPLAFLMVAGALRQMDPALEQAARVCGAGRLRTSWLVTLRLVSRGVISAFIINFVLGFEDLGVPLVLGNPAGIEPLPMRIWEVIQREFPADYNFAAAASVLLLTVPVLAFWLQSRITGSRARYTLSGKASAPQRMTLGWAKWPAFAFCLGWVFIAVILPMTALALTAFQRRWSGTLDLDLLTLDNFKTVFEGNSYSLPVLSAFWNSLVLAVVVATFVVIIAAVATYAVNRLRMRGGRWVEVVLSVPLAIPGSTIAVGLLNLLVQTPLYATIWIIAIGFAIRYFPYGLRTVDAAVGAIHPELEEASRVSGYGLGQTLRRVVMPLLRPAMVGGWLLLFVLLMRDVAMSNLLYAGGNRTLSVALLSISALQPTGVVAAFTLLQIVLFLVVAALAMLSGGARREALQV